MAKFSFEKFIDDLLSQPNYLPPDLIIDDREIPEAKNIIDFLHSEKFIGNMLPTGLFPRQVEILTKLNAEYCPNCTDLDYFGDDYGSNIPVNENLDKLFEKVQLLEYGICPKCKARKSQLYNEGKLNPHTEFVGLWGQRSGKSAVTSMQLSYSTHKFLKVPNLQRAYNLLPSSPFIIPMVGMSFERARQLLYVAYYEYLTKGNWFKNYYEFLDEETARLGLKEEIYSVKETFTRFRHKNILIAPFGPDKRKLRGNTSIGSATDEVGWFIAGSNDGIKFDADEIYAAVNNSLMTAKESYLRLLENGFDNLPAPININISSPSSKKDKICRLLADSKIDTFMLGSHLATWEVNPTLPLEGPTMQNLRKKNEKDFWRDFGAVPPNSSSSFFPDLDMFNSCYSNNSNICKIRKLTHFLGNQEYTFGELVIPKNESQKPARILAMDAGWKNNSFAFALAHLSYNDKKEKIPVFDALVEIIPEELAPLNYSKIFENIIYQMIKEFNVKLVCTDRWQNIKILSDIENDKKLRCKTKTYSVKYGDFLTFRQEVIDNKIIFPKPELKNREIELAGNDSYPRGFENKPVSHFFFQAITVIDLMGKTVSKGEGLTDDLFRAAVLANSLILNDEYSNLFKGSLMGTMKASIGAIPTSQVSGGSSRIGAIPTGSHNPYR